MATAKTKAQLQAEAKKKAAAAKTPAKTVAKPVAKAEAAAPVAAGVNLQHLTHIVTMTNGPEGFCYSPAEVNAPLAAAGLVEVKADVVDENGHAATRASVAGIAYVAAAAASPFPVSAAPVAAPVAFVPPMQPDLPAIAPAPAWTPTATADVAAPAAPTTRSITKAPEGGFKIITGLTPPPLTRSFGARTGVYPFDSMPVGGSFFVIATEARPKPAKSLASTVNSAMARHAVQSGVDAEGKPTFEKTRQVSLRAVQADTSWEDGSVGGAPWGYPGAAGAMVTRTK